MANSSIAKVFLTVVPKLSDTASTDITKGLNTGKVGSAFDSIGQASGYNMMSGLTGFIKGAGVTALVGAVADLGKQAVQAFAENEQLVGGVETLFKESADVVQEYAANAYKTAGLSANDYMETVTSFSASLLQSVGGDTAKAAEVADMAITDMADNANKMGTSMESIQNAYQGFAKQNYTMLDNLKLGYGGTKSEMERLLADAEELTGIEYDIDNLDDVYSAIHAIQGELGITGTTAEEADQTIEGSFNSMKASFDNFLVSLVSGNEDTFENVQNLGDSIKTFVNDNLIPAIINFVSDFIANLPSILLGAIDLIVSAAWTLLTSIWEELPRLVSNFITNFGKLIQGLVDYVTSGNFLKDMVNIGKNLIEGIKQGIKDAWDNLLGWFGSLITGLGQTVEEEYDINSPSKVFASYGKYMMQGLKQGIDDNANLAIGALEDVTSGIGGINLSAKLNPTGYAGGITIQNLTVQADDVLTADKFTAMVRKAAGAY